jgi:hypothetical protein
MKKTFLNLWYQLYQNPIHISLIYCLLIKCYLKGILSGITQKRI